VSALRRRYARGARFLQPDGIVRDFAASQRAADAFRGSDGRPLFAGRCPTCDIPLTYTVTRDGETLCLLEHVQKLVEWVGRSGVGVAVAYTAKGVPRLW